MTAATLTTFEPAAWYYVNHTRRLIVDYPYSDDDGPAFAKVFEGQTIWEQWIGYEGLSLNDDPSLAAGYKLITPEEATKNEH